MVPISEFIIYEHEQTELTGANGMVLDAQALENLEIFQVIGKAKVQTEGSLFDHMDKCVTKFGKWMLMWWVQSPLMDEEKLQSRLDAVEELLDNTEYVEKF